MANIKGYLRTPFPMYSARKLGGPDKPKIRVFPKHTKVTICADLGHVEVEGGNLYSYLIMVERKGRMYTAVINKDYVER